MISDLWQLYRTSNKKNETSQPSTSKKIQPTPATSMALSTYVYNPASLFTQVKTLADMESQRKILQSELYDFLHTYFNSTHEKCRFHLYTLKIDSDEILPHQTRFFEDLFNPDHHYYNICKDEKITKRFNDCLRDYKKIITNTSYQNYMSTLAIERAKIEDKRLHEWQDKYANRYRS